VPEIFPYVFRRFWRIYRYTAKHVFACSEGGFPHYCLKIGRGLQNHYIHFIGAAVSAKAFFKITHYAVDMLPNRGWTLGDFLAFLH